MNITFLYTLEANALLFRPYIEKFLGDKGVTISHYVNQTLLQQAVEHGLTEQVVNDVHSTVKQISRTGADIIVCTCSTIGDAAENTTDVSAKVIRVDRPMADRAVTHKRITVLAVLASTLEPTVELLDACAAQQNQEPSIITKVIPDVWPYYLAGDTEGYAQAIAAYINHLAVDTDIILLAQASMAPAGKYIRQHHTAVLTSPELCLQFIANEIETLQGKNTNND